MIPPVRRRSYRRPGKLLPSHARGLRARAVRLGRGEEMPWHSTKGREELLMVLRGRVVLEVLTSGRRSRRLALRAGECAFVPSRTLHRVVNRAPALADYIYVTGRASSR